MKQKMYLKNKHKMHGRTLFFIMIVLFTCITAMYLGKRMNKALKNYAGIEVERFITNIVNNVLDKDFFNEFYKENDEEIFIKKTEEENGTSYIDVNRIYLNELLNKAIVKVEEDLINIENGNISNMKLPEGISNNQFNRLKKGIVISVPTGSLLNNPLFSNLGPKIPVKIKLLGKVVGNIDIKVSDYGINNSLIEIYLVIKIKEQIVLPISSNEIKEEVRILVATRLIHGEIPNYLLGNIKESS